MDYFVSVEPPNAMQKIISDAVSFSKVTSLHCADCSSYTKYILLEHVPEISCYKKNNLRKKVYRLFVSKYSFYGVSVFK